MAPGDVMLLAAGSYWPDVVLVVVPAGQMVEVQFVSGARMTVERDLLGRFPRHLTAGELYRDAQAAAVRVGDDQQASELLDAMYRTNGRGVTLPDLRDGGLGFDPEEAAGRLQSELLAEAEASTRRTVRGRYARTWRITGLGRSVWSLQHLRPSPVRELTAEERGELRHELELLGKL